MRSAVSSLDNPGCQPAHLFMSVASGLNRKKEGRQAGRIFILCRIRWQSLPD